MKDSVPTKIYEALGIGCPVLLVAEGESTSIVAESRLGKSVSPDYTESLTAVFDEMIDNYSSLESNRDEAKKLMLEKYSRQKIAAEFERKLRNLCNTK